GGLRGELRRADGAENGVVRMGAGACAPGGVLLAAPETDGAHAPAVRGDPRGRGRGPDRGAEPAGRRGHRLGDRAHAAEDVAVEALEVVVAAGEQVEEQTERRPRRIRSAVFAVDVVGEKERLD